MAKYAIELSSDLERTVKELAKEEHLEPTEVIERAIALYKYLIEQKRQDKTLALLESTGEINLKLSV